MTAPTVLVVNAGSSSLKLSVLRDGEALAEESHAGWDGDPAPVRDLAERHDVDVVGHRVVHAGPDLLGPVLLDDDVRRRVEDATPLAPLHQPAALRGVDAGLDALPRVPVVLCFDTDLHHDLPAPAATYAVPREWRERWRLRRYGAHGLSHAWVSRRTPELLGQPVPRLLSCHLGSGASLCAVRDGRSIDTTMGLTPLEGLVMGSRSGTVDPGLVLWLLEQAGLDPAVVRRGLEEEGGLTALCGTDDVAAALEAAESGDGPAGAAVEVYLHRLAREAGAMVGVLGGVDAVAVTGGVGEGSALVRRRLLEAFAHLGLEPFSPEPPHGPDDGPDLLLTTSTSSVAAVLVHAREDLEVERGCRRVLGAPG